MESKMHTNSAYKKMICAMVQDVDDRQFLRRVHEILFREQSKTCQLQRQLHALVEEMSPTDLRLLYIAALELVKGGKTDG